MVNLVKSKTDAKDKNRWATNWLCYDDAVKLNGKPFSIDIAAEPDTRKVNRFMVSPDWMRLAKRRKNGLALVKSDNYEIVAVDALSNEWEGNWWCNPPFDLKKAFLAKVAIELKKGHSGMMLLPYEPLNIWWKTLVAPIATCVYEPDGRYGFYETDGKTEKHGVNFGSVFVVFTPEGNSGLLPRVPFSRGRFGRLKGQKPEQLIALREKYLG